MEHTNTTSKTTDSNYHPDLWTIHLERLFWSVCAQVQCEWALSVELSVIKNISIFSSVKAQTKSFVWVSFVCMTFFCFISIGCSALAEQSHSWRQLDRVSDSSFTSSTLLLQCEADFQPFSHFQNCVWHYLPTMSDGGRFGGRSEFHAFWFPMLSNCLTDLPYPKGNDCTVFLSFCSECCTWF